MKISLRNNFFAELGCLTAIVIIVCLACNLQHSLFYRPSGVHTWRQCDGASYALNYYQNKQPFFEPQTHTLTGDNGHAVSEFPIVYYIAGKLYSVFGFHDYILRLLHGLLFLLGIFYTWLLARQFIKKPFFSLIPPTVLLTAPYLFFYGPNFLPDVPALSLAIVSFYYFIVYSRSGKLYQFLLFMLAAVLAGLLKISAGILPLTAIALWVIYQANFKGLSLDLNPKLKKQRMVVAISFLTSIAIVYAWTHFAVQYNLKNHTGQNLLGLFPIWDASKHEIANICKRFVLSWSHSILTPAGWITLVIATMLTFIYRHSINKVLLWSIVISFVGIIFYSIGWFCAYYDHDYYMINVFCFPLLLVIGGCVGLENWWHAVAMTRKIIAGIVISCLFVNAVWYCGAEQWKRYHDPVFMYYNPVLRDIEPYLRSIGIDRHQIVMSVPDPSPNITLYFINNPGYTEAFNWGDYNLYYFQQHGCHYLIVSDTVYLHNDFYKPFMKKQVGYYKGVYVFDIK